MHTAFFYGGAVSAQIVFYKDPALMFQKSGIRQSRVEVFLPYFL